MTRALRDKITNEELAILKGHVRLAEELIQEDDKTAAQNYLEAVCRDAQRIAALIESQVLEAQQ